MNMDRSCSFCNELLGSIYFSKGDYARAIDLLEKSATSNPNNDSVAVMLGDALIFTNQLRRAVIYYEKAFSINPKNDKTLYKLCASKIDLGMVNEAESIMNNNKGRKKTGWVHLAQARVLEATGNLTVAEFSYNAALNALPNNSDACFGLGRIYLEQKKFSKAVESFSMAMVEKPDDVNVFIGMGKGYYGLKNYSAAMELFTDVLKKDPSNYDANAYMGFIYNKNNKHDRAITHLVKALQKEEKNADLHFMLAVEYGMVLRYEESIESFLKAAKYDDSKATAIYKNVGDLYYYKLKDNKKAKKYYDKYLKSGGNNPKVKTLMESL